MWVIHIVMLVYGYPLTSDSSHGPLGSTPCRSRRGGTSYRFARPVELCSVSKYNRSIQLWTSMVAFLQARLSKVEALGVTVELDEKAAIETRTYA